MDGHLRRALLGRLRRRVDLKGGEWNVMKFTQNCLGIPRQFCVNFMTTDWFVLQNWFYTSLCILVSMSRAENTADIRKKSYYHFVQLIHCGTI